MIQYILWALLAYVLYRFIFNFVVPLVRASRDIKKQVNEFKSRMQEQQDQSQFRQAEFERKNQHNSHRSSKEGDYIEFEEIRDRN